MAGKTSPATEFFGKRIVAKQFQHGVCVPCLRAGHDCAAIDIDWKPGEEPKCAFCEDGMPCPRTKANGSSVKAASPLIDRVTSYNGGVPPKEIPMEENKICGRPGCAKKLAARNESGFCTAHFYDSKKKSATDSPKTIAARKTKAPVVSRGGHSNGHSALGDMAVLQVSREQLVSMFSAWPLQDQAGCVQLWLNRMSTQS